MAQPHIHYRSGTVGSSGYEVVPQLDKIDKALEDVKKDLKTLLDRENPIQDVVDLLRVVIEELRSIKKNQQEVAEAEAMPTPPYIGFLGKTLGF